MCDLFRDKQKDMDGDQNSQAQLKVLGTNNTKPCLCSDKDGVCAEPN